MRGLVFALVLAGCVQSDAEKAEAVCTTFCDCETGGGLPAVVEMCVRNDCLPALTAPVSDQCTSCVHSHQSACTALEDTCINVCFSQFPDP
jgi:hypothetical protein